MPSSGDGLEARLRRLAVTILGLAIAIYVAVHIIVAAAPVLITIGAVVAAMVSIWVIIRHRRGW